MADSKIKDLTPKVTGDSDDEFVINDVTGGDVDKKMGMDGLRLTESQITDLQAYLTNITGEASTSLTDTANIVYNNQANTYTGAGTQDFAGSILDNVSVFRSNTASPPGNGVIRLGNAETISYRNGTDSGNIVAFTVNASNEVVLRDGNYAFSTTQSNWSGNNLINVGYFESNATAADAGTLRLGNNESIQTRNAGNTANLGIEFDSSDLFGFVSTTEKFQANIVTNHDTLGTADSAADFLLIHDATDGIVKKILPNNLGLASTDLTDTSNIAYLDTTNAYLAGLRQDFLGLTSGTAGLNVGGIAGNPTTQVDGDVWLNTSTNQIFGRINGADVDLSAGAGGGEANTHSSQGGGTFNLTAAVPKSGVDLQLISISNGNGINASLGSDILTLAIASTVPETDQANTYTAGVKQTLSQSATTAGLNLGAVAAAPSTPAEGDVWYQGSDDTINYRDGAAGTLTLATTTDLTSKFDTAGTGLTSSGTTVNAIGTTSRISVSADAIDIDSGYVGQASITTLGTISTGTWEGTTVAVLQGGTGTTTSTGTGSVVLSSNPTLVNPALGTPSALVGTNITGTATAFTASNVTTNANLTGDVTSVGNATTVVTNANLTGDVTSVGNATTIAAGSVDDAMMSTTDDAMLAGIEFVIDGGGVAITTGVKGYLEIPFNCTIERVTLLADQTGSIVVDIWKDTYANYPPVDADSITASAVPTITTSNKAQDATLTGWTTTISEGDVLGFNVDSITTHQRVTVSLKVRKT